MKGAAVTPGTRYQTAADMAATVAKAQTGTNPKAELAALMRPLSNREAPKAPPSKI